MYTYTYVYTLVVDTEYGGLTACCRHAGFPSQCAYATGKLLICWFCYLNFRATGGRRYIVVGRPIRLLVAVSASQWLFLLLLLLLLIMLMVSDGVLRSLVESAWCVPGITTLLIYNDAHSCGLLEDYRGARLKATNNMFLCMAIFSFSLLLPHSMA